MSDFASRITRSPRPYAPDLAAEAVAAFGQADPAVAEVLAGAAGASPYLRGLILKETDWLRGALAGAPEAAFDALLDDVGRLAPPDTLVGLRVAKRRAALLIGLADLAGVFDLTATTRALTRLADVAVDRALVAGLAPVLRRGLLPGHTEDDAANGAGLAVLAMGKMGAFELNYSSDIDLICLFDETRFDPSDIADVRSAFVKAIRSMTKILSERTADGYVFRTDLRLRPDAAVTPVAMSMEAAERYYEAQGRTWERAAFIKARAAAGDVAAGQRFIDTLTPFVWRRHLDFWAIEDAHAMRLKIRDAKGLHQSQGVLGRDVKLGVGGIREIEFYAQTRQMIAGGRDPGLRVPDTRGALAALAEAGWVDNADAKTLTDDYVAHRNLEHRIQMVGDQQTHMIPNTEDGLSRLAALAGPGGADDAQAIEARFARVHRICEGFFAPKAIGGDHNGAADIPDSFNAVVARWPDYPALRGDRAREVFARLRGGLLARLAGAADPDAAVLNIDRFLAGLPAGVQVFSLFEANPQLLDLVVDIADTAPGLAGYLARNAAVFDAVIAGTFFAPWPGRAVLHADLEAALDASPDYEAKLDAARVWSREWHFRTGVHHLRGLISGEEAGYQYADLARAVLEALWPVVAANFAKRHGAAPGRGAAVLGMGSLGAGTLAANSDLDLIVIFDPDGVEASGGPKPLSSGAYYARLTQAFITALTALTGHGRLYEVDMRLRPSGRKGPVATSLQAFINYQSRDAWTWEHLALTRGRPVAGAPRLMGEVEAFRRDLVAQAQDRTKVLGDVADMRARLAKAHPGPASLADLKRGPGAMQDIELLASTAALLSGAPARGPRRQLVMGAGKLGLSTRDTDRMVALYARLSSLRQAMILSGGVPGAGTGAERFILSVGAARDIDTLIAEIARDTDWANDTIAAVLNPA
ncbi:MAG: glutamine-synthetase adenylyltransferase [Pseudomonadota bacterium]